MVPDGRTEGWTDGQTDGRTDDAKTISLRLRRGIKMRLRYCSGKFYWQLNISRAKRKPIPNLRRYAVINK